MAKRIVDEEMRFTVIINGDPAQKELYKVQRATEELLRTNSKLRTEKARLERQGKTETERYKIVTSEIKKNTTEINKNYRQMDTLERQIKVTGLTMTQLNKKASALRLTLKHMVPGSKEARPYEKQLARINSQLSKLKRNGRAAEGSISKLANGFNKYAALGASVIAVGTGIVLSLQKMIDYNGQLADAQSNVQKTTKLTAKETDELTKKFGLFKTRTARIELLKLAEEAGRLGKEGVDDVLNFVKVANQIKVALGDDLGDAQIREVGKMVNIYKVGQREGKNFEEAMLALGSSINEVSASGANQADFLVDFIKRTAGISDVANISAQDMIGLAAAFDEAGQSQEISATAVNKAYGSMAESSEKFAKIAGVSAKEFSRVLKEDANEALILFLKGLKKGNPSLEEMTVRLKGIELGGTRGKQAIGALAANVENLEEKQRIANDSLKEATSLTDEYNLKNNNLAASLSKIQKRLLGAFSSETVVSGLNNFVEWFAKFIGASEDADGSVARFRDRLVNLLKAVLVITVAILSYNTALKLSTIWTTNAWQATKLYNIIQKATAASSAVLRAVTLLVSAAYFAVTGNVARARAALVLFNRAMLLSPIGLLVAAVTALVSAYYLFTSAAEKAAKVQKENKERVDALTASLREEKRELNDLVSSITDVNTKESERKKLIKELIDKYPTFNKYINDEKITNQDLKKALKLTNEEYIKKIALKKFEANMDLQGAKETAKLTREKRESIEADYVLGLRTLKNTKLIQDKNIELTGSYELQNKTLKKLLLDEQERINIAVARGTATDYETKVFAKLQGAIDTLTSAQNKYNIAVGRENESNSIVSGIEEQIEKTKELLGLKDPLDDNTVVLTGTSRTPTNTPEPIKGTGKKKIDQKIKERAALLQLERETEDQRLALIDDSFAREMAINDVNQVRKIEDLYAKQDEILDAEAKARTEGKDDLASLLLSQAEEIQFQIETSERNHHKRRTDILSKGIQERLKVGEEEFSKQEQQRQIAHNNAMALLWNNKEAQKALQEKFDKEKLERQKANELKLIAELQKILDTSNFEGFNLDLLSDEQLASIKANLAELGLSVSEIEVLLAKLNGKDPEGLDSENQMDILGMSTKDWLDLFEKVENFEDLLGRVGRVAGAALQAYTEYSKYVTQGENQRLRNLERAADQEKSKQQNLLDNKLISKKQYDDAIKAQEAKVNKAKAEIEYKQAKREKQIAIASILINTAIGVSKALASSPPPASYVFAAVVAALGAAQLIMASKQELPTRGYEKGFYGNSMQVRREQDGKVFNADYGGDSRSGLVDKPTVFLAGEGGQNFPELIISGPDFKQFNPELKQSLYREIGRVKGYEKGYYGEQSDETLVSESKGASNPTDPMLIAVLQQNAEILTLIKKEGIEAYLPRNFTNAGRMREDIKRFEDLESKSKIKA